MKLNDRYDHRALDKARLKRAWSKSRLAIEADMNYQGVIRVLNGQAGIGLVHRVCRALGIDHMPFYSVKVPVKSPLKSSIRSGRK